MRLSTLVPVGSFLVAIVIASLTPSTRGLLRAAGETTGCKVVTTVTATLDSKTRTLGDDSIRDEKKKDIKKELGDALTEMGVDVSNDAVKKDIDDSAKEVQKKKLDALTLCNVDAAFTWVQTNPNQVDATVTAKFSVVTLLPKNAIEILKAHEEGHKLIAEKTKEWSKKKFKDEMDKAACDQASMDAAFDKALAAVGAVLDTANKDYDNKTNHGKIGTAAQQLTQAAAAFDAAAAAN